MEAGPTSWYWWLCWEFWRWCGWKQDPLLSSTLQPWRSLGLSLPHLCFISLSLLAKRWFFLKEELSCKEQQNRQVWSALLNGEGLFALQLSTAQCMKWKGCCGAPDLLFSISHPSQASRGQSSILNQSCQKCKMLQACCGSPVGVEGGKGED